MIIPKENKAVALITIVVLIFILTILSSAMLSILANQTRYVEHNVARAKAKYAAEATMIRELDVLRRTGTAESQHQVTGKYDTSQTWTVSGSSAPGGGAFVNTTQLNFTLNYGTAL
ncbi:MAG: hypothetical protein PHG69_06125 [Candidatus Omnitrophica bacterium]|nr:hypothetical protein [Candidatus Omnitrophota bacterium]